MDSLVSDLRKRITYPVGRVNGQIQPAFKNDDFDLSDSEDDQEDNKPYEQNFVKEEMKRYAVEPTPGPSNFADDLSSICDLSQVDSIVSEGKTHPVDIFKKYNFKLNTDVRKELPIDSYRGQILARIDLNQVIVIEGPTGCGKTTQVPQMVMDSYRDKNQYCNIVVTQPRKIATINVAKRVCEERGWTIGTVCGYQVGLEKKVSPDQIITYMTIGVLLQKLIRAKSLREYTHIIIDEVHERNQELDFLLLIVRKFLFTNSPQTKVVLMSATIRADEFAHYFRKQTLGQVISAPIIKVDKISPYNKTIFYLDQTKKIGELPQQDICKPEISDPVWKTFLFLIKVFNRLDRENNLKDATLWRTVLVFLPGINEIEEAHRQLLILKNKLDQEERETEEEIPQWEIIPLHSSLPNDEQALAFKPAKQGFRKIILSTNIAESSVTVPDSSYVIDFCLTKVMTVDPITKYMSLRLEWASHVNCDQRAGRVGRTCDGRVYRLVTREFYMSEMDKTSTPEILRAPLERIVLQAKMLDLNETPAQILALAMNPPNLKNIEVTIWQLKEMGGLLKTCRKVQSNTDGDITFLGQVMASLPLDVHLSKMILLGQLYSCLEETLIIAAGCSIQNIFSIPFQKRLDAYKKLLLWADGSCSDLIALLNLYTVWQNLKRENVFSSNKKELEWCQRNLVSLKGLREWNLLIAEVRERLTRLQIKETMGPGKITLSSTEKPTVLKIVMAGAFYPNFFIKAPEASQQFEREAVKTVGGRDPFSTIYFTGLDPKQPGQVYVRQIKRMLYERGENETDVHIGFDGSTKIYVEFKNNSREPVSVNVDGFQRLTNVPGKIPAKVYEMIRKRQLKYNFIVKGLPYNKAWQFAEEHGATRFSATRAPVYEEKNCFSVVNYDPIPSLDTQFVSITISNPIDAGHFWAQNSDFKTNELLSHIDEALNKQVLKEIDEPVKLGKLYAARYHEDGLFYRCKVTAIGGRLNQVLFIDYGNIQEVAPNELFYLPQRPQCHTAPLAYECVMYGIKPAYRRNPLGMWSESVNDHFRNLTSGILLHGQIYSVVNNVVELTLYRSELYEKSINDYMIEQGFADPCNPSFLSKQNNEHRSACQSSSNPHTEANRMKVEQIVSYTDFEDPEIDNRTCHEMLLKGPYSPLETKLASCTTMGLSKSVDIEGTSVNAVLLDSEPESNYSRLLVAAYVGQSVDGNRLKLRQTTLLPNVPGFPMLLAAIFCPTMEPKLTADNTHVAAILCGLGYNENTNKSLYPAHDILIGLDTELKTGELEEINKLRYLMNSGMKLMYEMGQNRTQQQELLNTQIKIHAHLFGLINMERRSIDRTQVYPENTQWGRHGGLGRLKPNLENEPEDIWSLLWFVRVVQMNQHQKDIMCFLKAIENMLQNQIPFEALTCLLCNYDVNFMEDLRMHVISSAHKREVERFKNSLNCDDESD